MLLEIVLNVHVDQERWTYLASLDSPDEVPDDVIEYLKDTVETAFDNRDQQGLLEISYKIL